MGRLSHEVGWKYKAVVRTLENKRRVRAILEVQKRNKLKVTYITKLSYNYSFQIFAFKKLFLTKIFLRFYNRIFILQKLTKQAGEAVSKATAPYTKIINDFGYN